jgi:hypothetical protein
MYVYSKLNTTDKFVRDDVNLKARKFDDWKLERDQKRNGRPWESVLWASISGKISEIFVIHQEISNIRTRVSKAYFDEDHLLE